jgi:hypothetical protein
MSEIHLVHFSFGDAAPVREPRQAMTAAAGAAGTAVPERAPKREHAAQAPFSTRLRLAFAGRSIAAANTCSCPA